MSSSNILIALSAIQDNIIARLRDHYGKTAIIKNVKVTESDCVVGYRIVREPDFKFPTCLSVSVIINKQMLAGDMIEIFLIYYDNLSWHGNENFEQPLEDPNIFDDIPTKCAKAIIDFFDNRLSLFIAP